MNQKNMFKAYCQSVINDSFRFLPDAKKNVATNKPSFNVAIPWPIYYEIDQIAKMPLNRIGQHMTTRSLIVQIVSIFFMTATYKTMQQQYAENDDKLLKIKENYTILNKYELIEHDKMTKSERYWMRFEFNSRFFDEKSNVMVYDAMVKLAYSTTPAGVGDRIYTRTYMICMALASFLDDFSDEKEYIDYIWDALSIWTADGFR